MIVQDLNRFLRGWAGYFRYGNSARHFDKITLHALTGVWRGSSPSATSAASGTACGSLPTSRRTASG